MTETSKSNMSDIDFDNPDHVTVFQLDGQPIRGRAI